MRNILILFLLISTLVAKAQREIPDLVTDRPDQTESSSVVPHKSLQIETGFLLENDETSFIEQKSFAYNTTLLRYGLLENFEIRLGIEYLGEEVSVKNTDNINSFSGLSPMFVGFKVKISEEEGLMPEIAFLGGLVLPFTAQESFKPDYSSANIRFAFSHSFSERFSLGYNLGAEWDGETAIPGYFYSVALGFGLTDKIGMFTEGYGLLKTAGESEHLIDAGFTYLVMPNFQVDFSCGIGLNDIAIDNFLSLGLTYRLVN